MHLRLKMPLMFLNRNPIIKKIALIKFLFIPALIVC